MKTRASVMLKPNEPLVVETLDLEPPKDDEVLVRIDATSVCASDVNSWKDATQPVPCVLGHEGAATVIEVGREVKNVAVNDKVVLSWIPYCGHCRSCQRDKPQLCQTIIDPMFEGTLLDGGTRFKRGREGVYQFSFLSTFSEYSVVPANSCIKLNYDVPKDIMALFGCGVATGYGAARRAVNITPNSNVLVLGLGMVGISAIMGAQISGAQRIIACDAKQMNIDALKRLKQFGDVEFLNVTHKAWKEELQSLVKGEGIDYALDCTGSTKATESILDTMAPGGEVIVVGAFHQPQLSIPAPGFHRKSITIKGSFYGDMNPPVDFDELAKLYQEGRLNYDGLLEQANGLEDLNDVFKKFLNPDIPNYGRVLIHP